MTENIEMTEPEVEDQISNPTSENVRNEQSDDISQSSNSESANTEDNAETDSSVESNDDDQQDSFPRSYVEKLRDENAKYRQRAQQSDDLAQRLHTALVAATGRLHDPTDIPFDEAHLDDPEALEAAIEDLVAKKPHLAARRPRGDVGQGATRSNSTVDLAGLLRARA